jgi:hypothetical protein
MAKGLLHRLQTKVEQIHSDNWGEKDHPVVRLDCDIDEDEDSGRLTGRIQVYIRTGDGCNILVHERILNRLDTEEDVDDCLAETLSVTLMKHSDWPKKTSE